MREGGLRQKDQHVQKPCGTRVCGIRKAVWPEGRHAVWEVEGRVLGPVLGHLVGSAEEGHGKPRETLGKWKWWS